MRGSLSERLVEAACRLCLLVIPAAQRRRDGRAMLADLRSALRDARLEGGRTGLAGTLAAECFDLVGSGLAARLGGYRLLLLSFTSLRGLNVFPTLFEWRHALRRVAANPIHSLVIIAALALGIGANTVVFSVADAVLFRAPFPNAPRLVELFNQPAGMPSFFPGLAVSAVDEWRHQSDIFTQVEGFEFGSFVVRSGPEPEEIPGAYVTPDLFGMLGVRPALGRPFVRGEELAGRNRVAILSHELWDRHFGASPNVIGQAIEMDTGAYTVVGVMPRGFRFPSGPQKLWLPGPAPGSSRLQAVGLLAPGVTDTFAQERSDVIAASLQRERPLPMGWGIRLMPLRGTMMNDTTRQAVKILLAAVILVLLIACANVANLFLAQAIARDREMSVRAALGGTRWRLTRETLAEGLLLALLGGGVAVVIAWWGVEAVIALAPDRITRLNASEIRVDGRTLAFTAAVTLLTGLLFAIVPAVRASRSALIPALAGRTSTGGRSHRAFRAALVVAEVALSVLVLVGAMLLTRSLVRLQGVEIGYDTRDLLQVTLALPADRYDSATEAAFFTDLQRTIASIPSVQSVTAGNGLPGNGSVNLARPAVDDRRPEPAMLIIPGSAVAPDYFAALGIPIVQGRTFMPADGADAVIVSQSMAAKFWPASSAVGGRIKLSERDPWQTVVGVAGEIKQEHRQQRFSEFEVYTHLWSRAAQEPRGSAVAGTRLPPVTLLIRAENPLRLMPLIKQAVWRLEPGQPVGEGVLAEHTLMRIFAEQRFTTTLMALFGGLALTLAVAGLYAVLSQVVVQHTHEIGLRIALGARNRDVLELIAVRGMSLVLGGVVLGLVAAYVSSSYIRAQLYAVSPTDPWSFAAAAMLMITVAILACWIPTRKALSIDPIGALRNE